MAAKSQNRLICVIGADDITPAVTRQRDRESIGGVSPWADSIMLGRQLDEGFILVVHGISELSDHIRQNVRAFFICGLQGEHPGIVCNTLGITMEQFEAFRSARPGHMLCINPDLFPKPVYATFSQPTIPGKYWEIGRQAAVAFFLKMVRTTPPVTMMAPSPAPPTTPPSSVPAATMPVLSAQALAMLIYIAMNMPKPITHVYEALRLARTQGRKIAKHLEELGLFRIYIFTTGRKGGRLMVPRLTLQGWDVARQKGIARPKSRTNGDDEHEIGAELVEAEGKKLGQMVSFEVDQGGFRADVLWLDRAAGRRHIFNIGISDPNREVTAIERFHRLSTAQGTTFTLVARDVAFAQKVRQLLQNRDSSGQLQHRIEIKLIADYLMN